LLTYMRLGGIQRGLLLNFHSELMKGGLKRLVLNYQRCSAPPRLRG